MIHLSSCSRRNSRTRISVANRSGFTLLEVILALAVLAGGMALIGEVTRRAQLNGRQAQDSLYAQMLCEAKMGEIVSGVTPLDPVEGANFGPPYDGWLYSVDTSDLDVPGLIAVMVTVKQDLPPEKWPVIYSMVHWMTDPGVDLAAASSNSDSSSQNSSGSSSNNSSSSGSSSSGSANSGASK